MSHCCELQAAPEHFALYLTGSFDQVSESTIRDACIPFGQVVDVTRPDPDSTMTVVLYQSLQVRAACADLLSQLLLGRRCCSLAAQDDRRRASVRYFSAGAAQCIGGLHCDSCCDGQADCSSQNIVFSPKLAAEAGDIDAIPELEEQACLICAEPITYFMIGTLPSRLLHQTAHERRQENVTTGKPVPFACSV